MEFSGSFTFPTSQGTIVKNLRFATTASVIDHDINMQVYVDALNRCDRNMLNAVLNGGQGYVNIGSVPYTIYPC